MNNYYGMENIEGRYVFFRNDAQKNSKSSVKCSAVNEFNIKTFDTTECVTYLEKWSEMTIFEWISTTFKSSTVFRDSWGRSVNWLGPKIDLP